MELKTIYFCAASKQLISNLRIAKDTLLELKEVGAIKTKKGDFSPDFTQAVLLSRRGFGTRIYANVSGMFCLKMSKSKKYVFPLFIDSYLWESSVDEAIARIDFVLETGWYPNVTQIGNAFFAFGKRLYPSQLMEKVIDFNY